MKDAENNAGERADNSEEKLADNSAAVQSPATAVGQMGPVAQAEPQTAQERHAIETRRAVEAAHSPANQARLKRKASRFGGRR